MDSLIENMTGYVETRIELMKIEMKEEVSKVLAKALIFVVLTSVFTLFILLISMAAAYKIGESLGAFGGFSAVAGFYFLIGLVIFLLRDSIAEKIETKLQDIMKKKEIDMELLQSNDIKMELLKKSAKHRQELEDEVKLISEKTEKMITNGLIIGGTLLAAYFLVRQFSGSAPLKKSKSPKIKVVQSRAPVEVEPSEEYSSPGIVSQIGTALASQATIFLLGIAKEKLSEYLSAQFDKKGSENERS